MTKIDTYSRVSIAEQFCRGLSEVIPRHLATITRAWLANPDPALCPSGDYCDSNMVMDAAFHEAVGREALLPSDWEEGRCTEAELDADMTAWDDAWKIAKAALYHEEACRFVAADALRDKLTREFDAWGARTGLELQSADEMLLSADLTPEQRDFLNGFVQRWEAAESLERN